MLEKTKGKNIELPKYWTDQSSDIEIFKVSENSEEFKEVQKKFTAGRIKKLERVQNKIVYQKYFEEKLATMERNEGRSMK